jgi:hypothetical protein
MSDTRPLVPHRSARWLFAGAAATLLLAQVTLPLLPSSSAARTGVVAAHHASVLLSAVFFLLAAALLVLAAAATSTMPLPRTRRTVTTGLVLAAIGALWPACGRATYNVVLVALADGLGRSDGTAAARAIDQSGASTVLLVTLAAFVVGPTVLMVGLWRARRAPVWPAVLWVVGVVTVNAAEGSSRAVAGVGMLAAAVGLGWLGSCVSATRATSSAPAPADDVVR